MQVAVEMGNGEEMGIDYLSVERGEESGLSHLFFFVLLIDLFSF